LIHGVIEAKPRKILILPNAFYLCFAILPAVVNDATSYSGGGLFHRCFLFE